MTARTPPGIFISYRRSDSGGYAGRLWDELAARYGERTVFWDIDTVAPGSALAERIESALAGCAAILVLVGPEWLEVREASGARRLDNPEDYVRREVAWALSANNGPVVIPILIEGTPMPAPGQLPLELRSLADRAAVELRNRSWSFDLGLLFKALDTALAEKDQASSSPRDRLQKRMRQASERHLGSRSRLAWLVGLIACAVSLGAYAAGALDGFERRTMDTRFSLRGQSDISNDIIIVGLDDKTLARYPRPPTMSRAIHARVIDRLSSSGVKAIAYDFKFDHAGPIAQDNALAKAIRRSAVDRRIPVVIAAGPPARAADTGQLELLFLDAFPDSVRGQLGAQVGIARLERDPKDLVLRRVLYTDLGKKSFSAIAAELASRGSGGDSPVAKARPNDWIDFAGPSGTYPHVSFADVLEGRVPEARLRRKLALVGPYTPNLPDVHATPVGPMYGVEAEANAIDTMRTQRSIKDGSGILTALAILILGLTPPLVASRWGITRAATAALVSVLAYLALTQAAFASGWVLTVVYPLLAALLGLLGSMLASRLVSPGPRGTIRAT